jgi:uncharacterized membrane protein YhaH (DUF805 family)
MGFNHAIETCWRNCLVLRGRARRSEFWWFGLFALLLFWAVPTLIFPGRGGATVLLSAGGAVLTVPPLLSAAVRRLHDVGFSGWWLLLLLLPLGVGVLGILLCWPGADGPNRYGPRPDRASILDPPRPLGGERGRASPVPRVPRR